MQTEQRQGTAGGAGRLSALDLAIHGRRLANLVAGAVACGFDPAAPSTGAEDFAQLVRECVTGERRLGRYVALTRWGRDHTDISAALFVYPSHFGGTLEDAIELAQRFELNDVAPEAGHAVLDLDLGAVLIKTSTAFWGHRNWLVCVPRFVAVSA